MYYCRYADERQIEIESEVFIDVRCEIKSFTDNYIDPRIVTGYNGIDPWLMLNLGNRMFTIWK